MRCEQADAGSRDVINQSEGGRTIRYIARDPIPYKTRIAICMTTPY